MTSLWAFSVLVKAFFLISSPGTKNSVLSQSKTKNWIPRSDVENKSVSPDVRDSERKENIKNKIQFKEQLNSDISDNSNEHNYQLN